MMRAAVLLGCWLVGACAGPPVVELPKIPPADDSTPPRSRPSELPTLAVTVAPPSAKAVPRQNWGRGAVDSAAAPLALSEWPEDFDREQLLPLDLQVAADGVDLRVFGKSLARTALGEWPGLGGFLSDLGDRPSPARVESFIQRVRAAREPQIAALAPALGELCRAAFLHSSAWRPGKTESGSGQADDGILQGAALRWRDRDVLQCATLVMAPLDVVLAVERDYRGQFEFVGQDAVDIFPVAGSHRLFRDRAGVPHRFVDVLFHKDLGFLLGELAYVLRHVDSFDRDGDLITDNYAAPGALRGCHGFKWLAGRNTYIAVSGPNGRTVATLVVTQLTFDIDGLWESVGHRLEAIRFSLGNLKRRAEELVRRSAKAPNRSR